MLSRRFSLRPTLSSCQRRFALQANAAQAAARRVSIMVGFIACAFLALTREFHYQIVARAEAEARQLDPRKSRHPAGDLDIHRVEGQRPRWSRGAKQPWRCRGRIT